VGGRDVCGARGNSADLLVNWEHSLAF